MDKELVLAVAGSGKTYSIAKRIREDERNVIFTFNVSNVENLKREIIKRFGYIPHNTLVMTFHSFRYKYIIKPNQYSLCDGGVELKGIDIVTYPPEKPNPRSGVYNKGYIKDDNINHYIVNNKIYSDYMSKLIIKRKLYMNLKEYMNVFVDSVYIDEFQDFEHYDYDVLKHLYKSNTNFYAYADYYQAGVSYSCSMIKRPYNNDCYEEYMVAIKKDFKNICVDVLSLNKSRRCGKSVTDFINEKIGNDIIFSQEINDTDLTLKAPSNIDDKKKIIDEFNSMKYTFIVWNKSVAKKYNIKNYVTWSISKGDTYSNVCLILTKEASKFLNGQNSKFSKISLNKLYVALTRATDNLCIIYD